ncbi:MAG: TonB-dependent receptor [Acidobacteriales bacterium]|nr:TonB-dependent receptor [Candidatus Koribacter versatilis]MBI3646212.1 TonB-dependent receptor [Terriglobales bacterium]
MKATLRLFCFAVLFALVRQLAFAQGVATGELHVAVKDPKGGAVANATVTARDQARAFERSTNTNVDGEYRLLALPPGTYTVRVDAPGFAKVEARDQIVNIGQMRELPIALSVAGAQETITVSSEAELVETQRSSSTDTINEQRIANLPINGRNYINFALTDSRLARDTAPSIGAAPGSGLNMSGQRARSNLVNVDGADAVDNSTNGIRSTVSQEAVQEFQIQTNGYAAEYGRASGGVVNIATKTGTNLFHGSAYGYLRNRKFQAINPFSTVSDPAYTRTQAGVTFGGPLRKDKTFYFFSWEGTWRQETGFSSIGQGNFGLSPFDASAFLALPPQAFVIQATPDQAAFLSVVPPGTPGIAQYVVLLGRSSGMALDGVWPGPPAFGGGASGFPTSCQAPPCFVPESFVPLKSLIGNFPVSERTDLYSLRLDHNFSNDNRLSLRGGVSPSDQTGIQVQAQGPQNFGQNSLSRTSVQNYHDWSILGQDQWTIGNNKINEFRFQYARRGLLYSFSRAPGGGNVAVNIPGFAFFGREPFSFVKRTEQRYQVTDNFSWSKGTHNIKFGIDGNFIPLTADFTVNFGGIYNFGQQTIVAGTPAFSPVQAYGAGIPSNFIQGVGGPHDAFSNTTAGAFLQDSWRVRSNLTLNYGVRYDVEFTPTFRAINSLSQTAQDSLGITQGIPRDFNNFAPRIGLAWDPHSNGKSVIRASYGMFYDHPLLALAFDSDVADASQAPQLVLTPGAPGTCNATLSNLNASNAFQGLLGCLPSAFNYLPDEQRFNPAPNAPSIFVGQAFLNPAAPVPLAFLPFGFPTAKKFQYAQSHQANLTFEQDLGHNLSLGLEYNFNGGRHNNRPINANAVLPGPLLANWQVALGDPTSGAAQFGPTGVGATGVPCGFDEGGRPWIAAALGNFFRPSGLNPALAQALLLNPAAAPCVGLALQILQADGIRADCDPTTLANCVPFSDMPTNFSSGSSVYHGLTANLRKRFGQHYEFLASYTWSHAIDDSTDLQSPLSPQDNHNPGADRSTSLFDQRHRFVFSGVYQTGSLGNGFARKLFSDWTIAPMIEVVSGRPFNIITGADRNFDFGTTTDRPLTAASGATNSCGDTAAPSRHSPTGYLIPACFLDGTLTGNLGRNAGTKPHNIFIDLGISKRIPLGERVAFEARMDAFNLINKFNVLDVNPLWNSGQKATSASDPRQFQFSLRLRW